MKKLICILTLIAMLAGLAACKKDEPVPIEPEPDVFDWDTFELYTIFTDVYQNNNITIPYPQIDELLDVNLQANINLLIQAWALEILENYEDDYYNYLTLEMDYEVTRTSDNLMSAVFRGTAFAEGDAHPSHILYTVNVDTVVGVEVALVDVVTLNDEFVEIFKAHAVTATPDADSYIKENDNEFLLGKFRSADMFGGSDTFSYYTDDSIVICMAVPHAIGGYAEFELRYDDLGELLHEMRI
ncbi:MAG: DUF4163 domain-containing protein [Oscillospiraceae bacterium]|nr:DUF4163 domain-containing protein [Oscillospiraceae bacterium]